MDLEKRIKMAAESILENESLREGLDDKAASALLDWGVARAQQITAATANVEDDEEAQEAVYPRMSALSQMLRDAAGLCAENVDSAQQTGLLQGIADQVPLVYGPESAFETGKWTTQGSAAQIINNLRASIEGSANNAPAAKTLAVENAEKKQETQAKPSFFDGLTKFWARLWQTDSSTQNKE